MKSGNKTPIILKSFPGTRIGALRKRDIVTTANREKMTQAELACAVGVADGFTVDPAKPIRTYEKGKCSSAYIVHAIADYYDVSIDYLLGLDDCLHIGNKEISDITGLSEKSVEVLRYLNKFKETRLDDVAGANKAQLKMIDLLLSTLYDQCKADNEFPVTSIFLAMSRYIGADDPTIKGKPVVTIENNNSGSDMVSVNEVYRPLMLKRIEDYLIDLSKEVR